MSNDNYDRIRSIFENHQITSVLGIDVGDTAFTETHIRDAYFPRAKLTMTDSANSSRTILKMSPSDAICNHPESDVLIIKKLKNTNEYAEIPYAFNGKFIIVIGNLQRYYRIEEPLLCLWKKVIDTNPQGEYLTVNPKITIFEKVPQRMKNLYMYEKLKEYHIHGKITCDILNADTVSEMKNIFLNEEIGDIICHVSTNGKLELAIGNALFPEAHISISNQNYSFIGSYNCDLLILSNPSFTSDLNYFEGKYLIFIGPLHGENMDPRSYGYRLNTWGTKLFEKELISSELLPQEISCKIFIYKAIHREYLDDSFPE